MSNPTLSQQFLSYVAATEGHPEAEFHLPFYVPARGVTEFWVPSAAYHLAEMLGGPDCYLGVEPSTDTFAIALSGSLCWLKEALQQKSGRVALRSSRTLHEVKFKSESLQFCACVLWLRDTFSASVRVDFPSLLVQQTSPRFPMRWTLGLNTFSVSTLPTTDQDAAGVTRTH